QLYSETAKIHAGSIGIRTKCRLIVILWVKTLIFQGAKLIFNVGSLSNLAVCFMNNKQQFENNCNSRISSLY
ncbi:MAG: hypothetical protein MSD68_10945, partial [Blautia sp.]|uniref:hypothetical protein n=1 Tax=Blautia sp. TaxID=1955243 RepID=UPI0025C07E85